MLLQIDFAILLMRRSKKYDRKIDVDVISLNNALKKAKFINDYPILIKIDIEGLEKKVGQAQNLATLQIDQTGINRHSDAAQAA